jgi:multimeric flavodoxin WrbA
VDALVNGLADARILFAVAVDTLGVDEAFVRLLRILRSGVRLDGCVAGIVVDGADELYTKAAAQELALAANMAGCTLPGKPLVEGTGSLYNQHILARRKGLSWEETYFSRAVELVERLVDFKAPRFERPNVLMIHASDNLRSNTVWLGRQILQRLPENFSTREISLQNGTIHDCRGCSYAACLHFSQSGTCFYGGAISQEVLPAIRECDAMLFLCPNYNDAVSANLMALFNRMTNLLVQQELLDKYLFGIVVSGYSGSDIVARQLLGALCFNKTVMLPPQFAMLETAHDPGSAKELTGVEQRLDDFAAHMVRTLQE